MKTRLVVAVAARSALYAYAAAGPEKLYPACGAMMARVRWPPAGSSGSSSHRSSSRRSRSAAPPVEAGQVLRVLRVLQVLRVLPVLRVLRVRRVRRVRPRPCATATTRTGTWRPPPPPGGQRGALRGGRAGRGGGHSRSPEYHDPAWAGRRRGITRGRTRPGGLPSRAGGAVLSLWLLSFNPVTCWRACWGGCCCCSGAGPQPGAAGSAHRVSPGLGPRS